MTTLPKVARRSFETRGAKDADPATAALVDNIARSRETDYFLMKDQLTDQEKEIMAKVRAFGEAEVLPVVNDYWERGEFPFELIPKSLTTASELTTLDTKGLGRPSRRSCGLAGRGELEPRP